MPDTGYISGHLVRRISEAQEAMKGFSKELLKDPGHAFEWADASMKMAASLLPMQIVLRSINKGQPLDEILQGCRDEAMRHCKFPRMSTSPASNAMHAYAGAAWAELADLVAGGL